MIWLITFQYIQQNKSQLTTKECLANRPISRSTPDYEFVCDNKYHFVKHIINSYFRHLVPTFSRAVQKKQYRFLRLTWRDFASQIDVCTSKCTIFQNFTNSASYITYICFDQNTENLFFKSTQLVKFSLMQTDCKNFNCLLR